ncbi:MAG: sigma-54-dependent Fis family transcriptional regulator [Candidatus Riflebacteria bacterium]|nr:sigma-54-dependent Fis family transcriptional regulator [Candidatus Riflebacteria bacterium]
MKPRVLVIDDLESSRSLFERFLGPAGYEVVTFASVKPALEELRKGGIDLVVTDLKMPEMDGMEAMREIRELDPTLPIIMVTAFATVDTAVEAMRLGAFDYIRKPFDPEEVKIVLQRALRSRDLERENQRLRARMARDARANITAVSQPMKDVLALVERIAPADVTVLILGETGTGKERASRLLHASSSRAAGPFVSLNCSAIPENLLESELFGHVKGAFSGATGDRPGFLAEASGGTLFLDELGDLSPALQPKLLRVLQSGEYYPVGGTKVRQCDARVLCATNQDLGALVAKGTFRADLYYRVNVVTVRLPALRQRAEDIPVIAGEFLAHYSRKFGVAPREFSAEVRRFLQAYPWPGNGRQLQNVVERAVLVASGETVEMGDLPGELLGGIASSDFERPHDYEAARDAFEKAYLTRLLESAGGNVSTASRMAGVHRATLYKWLIRHGLQRGEGL